MRLLRAFEAERLEHVLIGATALGFHGIIRATEDVDVMLRATAENIERLRRALKLASPDDDTIDQIRDDGMLGEHPFVRYYPPSGHLFVDAMTRLGTAANYESIEAELKEIDGIKVRVATPMALYRLKRDTVRPLDRQDAAALAKRFNLKPGD